MRGTRINLAAAAAMVAALGAGSIVAARELDAPRVLERVQAWLDGTHDLQARFEQELVSGAFGAGTEESGRLCLSRPGRMRWDYTSPEVKVAIVDGERTLLYVQEDEQMWEGRLDDAEALLPTLLAGEEPLANLFTATLEATPKTGGGEAYRLRLVPVDASESFEVVVLTLRPPAFALDEVEVLDIAGNRMHYVFTDIGRNEGLSPAAFHFEPPPGTEILVATAPASDP